MAERAKYLVVWVAVFVVVVAFLIGVKFLRWG